MTGPGLPQSFGCIACWPKDADAAWEARQSLHRGPELVEESHFRVAVMTCPHCDQARLSIFVEQVDWTDGEDPQHWTVLPIYAGELTELLTLDPPSLVDRIARMGSSRLCLHRDFPKGGDPRVGWSTGVILP